MTMLQIASEVAAMYHIPVSSLKGPRQAKEVSDPRALAMYLCRRLTFHSYPQIGRFFFRDHTTIIHAVRKVERAVHRDERLRKLIDNFSVVRHGVREPSARILLLPEDMGIEEGAAYGCT